MTHAALNVSGANHVDLAALKDTLDRQRSAFSSDIYPDFQTRKDRLDRLEVALEMNFDRLVEALNADFSHRSAVECKAVDLVPALGSIRFARKNLKRWMRARRVSMPLHLQPARGKIVPQPLGVVGIISPWNFPVFLSIAPMAAAIAAGNRVMMKPSELSQHTSEVLRQMIADNFDPSEVSVLTGGPEIGSAFSALPFDHLLFTGSTQVGRKVAVAAAANLTPVTLELGGKSPAIVTPNADLKRAAKRIAWGKTVNAGQICVAPDYALVPKAQVDAFADLMLQELSALYPDGASSPDYGGIISDRHLNRLSDLVKEAEQSGAKVLCLQTSSTPEGKRALPPTLIVSPDVDLGIMQEEIFGPVLPVIAYDATEDAVAFVQNRDRPLALYVFSESKDDHDFWASHSISGGMGVNEVLLHVGCDTLPFGGVGSSGMGAYHGDRGFETFSHMKSVFTQAKLNGAGLLTPPYNKISERVVALMKRFS
jgi:acyl-CoA reductase-like NAD-dependent aldehyde dehydrogenase